MSQGDCKGSGSKILWVDLSRDANMIDGIYREETRLQNNSARLKAAQCAVVEVCEMRREEIEEVLKPESAEESSLIKPSNQRRLGRRGKNLKVSKSASLKSRRRRPYRKQNRLKLLLTRPKTLYDKRQRKVPREFDDYQSFFDSSRPIEDEDTDINITYDEDSSGDQREKGYRRSGDSVVCFACGKSFLPTTLEAHVRQIHGTFPNDQCFICGEVFPTVDDVRLHIKTVHYSICNYKCVKCDKGYYYYLKLVKHLRSVHHLDSPPTREECRAHSTAFHNHTTVDLDSQEVGEDKCRCLVCLGVFPIDEMKTHMNDYHRAFPRARCYICGQRFPSSQEAFEHIESTHLSSMHTCLECETNFDGLQEWKDHMEKVHQSETLYKCEQCGKVFGWKKFLRQHIRREHVGDGSGSVFAMRDDFRAEKTTLREECDRQKRLLEAKAAEESVEMAESETKSIEVLADAHTDGVDSNLNNSECNEPSELVCM